MLATSKSSRGLPAAQRKVGRPCYGSQ